MFIAVKFDQNKNPNDVLQEIFQTLTEPQQGPMYCDDCDLPLGYITTYFWLEGLENARKVLVPYCSNCHPELLNRGNRVV